MALLLDVIYFSFHLPHESGALAAQIGIPYQGHWYQPSGDLCPPLLADLYVGWRIPLYPSSDQIAIYLKAPPYAFAGPPLVTSFI